MARKAKPIILKGQELQELTSMSRSNKLDYRYVIRSRIILGLYQGKSYDQVQKGIIYRSGSGSEMERPVFRYRNTGAHGQARPWGQT
jgi:hypothetical protein